MDRPQFTAAQLTKSYPGGFQLGPVDLSLREGETAAFLGTNGAGKSTLFQLLTANLDPTAGEIRLNGDKLTPDTPLLKRRLGYLPQNTVLPRWVTGREILDYAARLYGLAQADAVVTKAETYWDCASFSHKPLMALSYGMQKRVALALATLHDPDYLILDEPHSGLDLLHIRALDEAILRRARAGKTTILSTHIAPYTARLCDCVYIIEGGQVRRLAGWDERSYLDRIELIEQAFFPPSAKD